MIKITYSHSVTKLGHIQVLRNSIDENGKESKHRYILSPGSNITDRDKTSKTIAQLLWTPEIIKLYEKYTALPLSKVKFWNNKGKNYGLATESQEAINIGKEIEKLVNIQCKQLRESVRKGRY